MAALVYLPLVAAVVLGLVVLLASVVRRIDRVLTRVALALFGAYVAQTGRRQQERKRLLRSAHVKSTYRVYGAKTWLYSGIFAVVGSIVGIYVIEGLIVALALPESRLKEILPDALEFLASEVLIPELAPEQLFLLLLVSSAIFGSIGGITTYYLRWWLPKQRADKREVLIDEGLPRTVAFIFALSRSGMTYPEILRTVARNRKAYGEAAEELTVVVKHMDIFGTDLLTATERVADTTPSDEFADFAENLASVLRSGRNVSGYLREQYEQHQSDQEARQEQLLEMFAALAEGYVAALVAGPLFLITILVIFGLIVGGTLPFLRGFVYLLLPLANLGFIVYLESLSTSLSTQQEAPERDVSRRQIGVRRATASEGVSPAAGPVATPDGGALATARTVANRERLTAYNRLRWLHRQLGRPAETLRSNPLIVLYVTIPVAVVALLVRAWPMLSALQFDVRVFDDLLVQSMLFVIATFAVVQEARTRWLREIEMVIPDFLDRLASSNQAGMSFVGSLKEIERSDLGTLDLEVERLVSDLSWGAKAESALYRLERRIGSTTVSQAVALITKSMDASNNIAPVLRIAADEAQANRRLQRKRRQELFTYAIVIYLSFFVFLGIVAVLVVLFIPSLPTGQELGELGTSSGVPGAGSVADVGQSSGVSQAAYELVFFHATVVQAVFSGFVIGQMSEGSVLNGAKHVTLMLTLSYGVFLLI